MQITITFDPSSGYEREQIRRLMETWPKPIMAEKVKNSAIDQLLRSKTGQFIRDWAEKHGGQDGTAENNNSGYNRDAVESYMRIIHKYVKRHSLKMADIFVVSGDSPRTYRMNSDLLAKIITNV